jgi:hypothetical protein
LVRCRGLDRLVVNGIVPISDGLADEFAFPETTATVDHDEICSLRLIAVRELIEFDIPINELLHTIGTIPKQIEFSILETAISEIVISN